MELRTGIRGRGSKLYKGHLITVDWFKMEDDEDFRQWFATNTDDGIGVKVVDYDNESNLIWVENCPYAIPADICFKD